MVPPATIILFYGIVLYLVYNSHVCAMRSKYITVIPSTTDVQ